LNLITSHLCNFFVLYLAIVIWSCIIYNGLYNKNVNNYYIENYDKLHKLYLTIFWYLMFITGFFGIIISMIIMKCCCSSLLRNNAIYDDNIQITMAIK
jgi:hypothetical protein